MAQEKQDSPSYKSMLLAYMDLLGFRKRVQEAGANANEIRQIWKILDSARELAQRRTNMTAVMTQAYQFSDTLVIAVEAAFPGAARLLLNWVTYFQMTALSDGWLVRGGIAEGDMMIEGSIWFGPGLIRAYDLERIVVDPVVVVDPQVYEQGSWIDCAFYCQEMPKGLPIVDYLGTTIAYGIFLEAEVANRPANWCSPIGSCFVAKHRDLVATALTNDMCTTYVCGASTNGFRRITTPPYADSARRQTAKVVRSLLSWFEQNGFASNRFAILPLHTWSELISCG